MIERVDEFEPTSDFHGVARQFSIVQNLAHLRADGQINPELTGEIAGAARRGHPLGDMPEGAEHLGEREAPAELEADGAVARELARAGQHQIAQARQACHRRRLPTFGYRKPAYFGHAARDERGTRVVAQFEPIARADCDRRELSRRVDG